MSRLLRAVFGKDKGKNKDSSNNSVTGSGFADHVDEHSVCGTMGHVDSYTMELCLPDHHTAGTRPHSISFPVSVASQRLVVHLTCITFMDGVFATYGATDATRHRLSLLRTPTSSYCVEHLQTASPALSLQRPARLLVADEKKSVQEHVMWHTGRAPRIGDEVDVMDTVKKWLPGVVVGMDVNERRVRISYLGWPQKWDEWISTESKRLQPSGLFTGAFGESANWHVMVFVLESVNDVNMAEFGPTTQSVGGVESILGGHQLRPPFTVRARRGRLSWSALLEVIFNMMQPFMVGGPHTFEEAVGVWESLPFTVELITRRLVACPLCDDLAYHRHRVLPSDELAWYSASMKTAVMWNDKTRYCWDPPQDWSDCILDESVPLPACRNTTVRRKLRRLTDWDIVSKNMLF